MIMKKFDLKKLKFDYLSTTVITYNQFKNMQICVIFEQEFKETFNVRNETIIIYYRNSRDVSKFQKKKIANPVINIFINNSSYFFPAVEFERMRYFDFIDYLVSICPDNYIADFYLTKRQQMTMGDYGL